MSLSSRPILAALAALALCTLPLRSLTAQEAAWPQRIELSGSVAAGFGNLRREGNPDTSAGEGTGEAVLHFLAAAEELSARAELTVVDDNATDTLLHEVTWQAAKSLRITLSGSAFDVPGTEGVLSVVNAPGGPLGDAEARIDYRGSGLIDVAYVDDTWTIGLALVDDCRPECGYAGENAVFPSEERGTALLHAVARLGAFRLHGYLAGSSGSFVVDGTAVEGTGSGQGAGVVFSQENVRVAVEFVGTQVNCDPFVSTPPCPGDVESTRSGAAIAVGGFAAHYVSGEDTVADTTVDVANLDVVYTFAVAGGRVGPEYRAERTEIGLTERTDHYLLLGASREF